MTEITEALNEQQITDARGLFRDYEAWLGMSLCFQSFEEEVATLPGRYARPGGRLYVAYIEAEPVGCIALREIAPGTCEMKRLYLREAARGKGIGVRLIDQVIADAKKIGYERMRLDTYPPKMGKAVSLYEAHGFYEIPAYYDNPHDGVMYMEKIL